MRAKAILLLQIIALHACFLTAEANDLAQVKAKTHSYLPWDVQQLTAGPVEISRKILPAFAGAPSSGRQVGIADLYIDRRTGGILAIEIVEAPHIQAARLLRRELNKWRFKPMEVNDNGPVKVSVALYFTYLGDGTMEVSLP